MIKLFGIVFISVILISGVRSIVSGKDAQRGQWTFIAALRYGGKQYCGGSIIGKRWILTAAHCLKHPKIEKKEYIQVVVGTHRRKKKQDPQFVYTVKEWAWHEDWNPDYENDIGLIYTDRDIKPFEGKVSIIDQSDRDSFEAGTKLKTAGWGRIYDNGPKPKKLQVLSMEIYDKKKCLKRYQAGDDNICGFAVTGKGTCRGDSGGPLIIPASEESPKDILIGITSWGEPPCGKHKADFFTNVYYQKNWINLKQETILWTERNELYKEMFKKT